MTVARAARRSGAPLAGVALALLQGCAGPLVTRLPDVDYAVSDPEFARTLSSLLGSPLVDGNQVTTLVSGEVTIPAMLTAIASAEQSITFETYVWWDSPVATIFADALAERALSGVPVHVLVDAFGANMSERAERRMRAAGVELAFFHPIWRDVLRPGWAPSNRTHRRILVIDGARAFTGGAGIGQQWLDDTTRPGGGWRDTQFVVEGPAVSQLQGVFAENWLEASGHLLEGARYFPRLTAAGDQRVQACASSPQGSASARVAVLLGLAAARETVHIMNAYFIPDELAVAALVDCARRGVRVQIILPGELTDLPLVRRASRARWGPLLDAGVEIYEYQPTMYHCKVLVVDGRWVTGGTTNFDPRSFHLNDEININILDAEVGAEQVRIFAEDRRRSRRVTLDNWRARSRLDRALDRVASWLGPML